MLLVTRIGGIGVTPAPSRIRSNRLLGSGAVAALLLTVCFGHIPAAAESPAVNPTASPFTVGVSAALTGPFAEYGIAVKRGIELAQHEQPELFSTIKFVFEDDGYEPKRTVAALAKLRDIDGAELLFIWGNEPALGAAPVAERRKIPTVVVAQHPQAGAGYRYVIRFINPAEDFSLALLRYLRSQPAYKKAAAGEVHRFDIIKSEISFFNILIDEFKNGLTDKEQLTIVDQFMPKDNDFRSTIIKLKALPLENLGVYLVPPQVGPFFRQAKELDFHPASVFGTSPFESSQVIASSLGEMEGAIYCHISALPEFLDRFKSRYGDDVQAAYAAQAYDFAVLAAELFGKLHKNMPPEEIIEHLTAVEERQGSLGNFRVRKDTASGTYFEFPVSIKQIKNGSITVLQTTP